MGIYKFNTTQTTLRQNWVYRSEAGPIGANGGATLVDAKYFYCITYTKLSGTTISNELICYDIESWTEVSRKAIPLTTISTDMTWNRRQTKKCTEPSTTRLKTVMYSELSTLKPVQ